MEEETKELTPFEDYMKSFKEWACGLTEKLHKHGITHPLPGEEGAGPAPAETTEEEAKQ